MVQCKKYGSPVGNNAVQEAFAGVQYHGASVACVVSNARYTKAAEQLAATTGVHLLHYSQLCELDKFVLGGAPQQ
jgi:restriction system protein